MDQRRAHRIVGRRRGVRPPGITVQPDGVQGREEDAQGKPALAPNLPCSKYRRQPQGRNLLQHHGFAALLQTARDGPRSRSSVLISAPNFPLDRREKSGRRASKASRRDGLVFIRARAFLAAPFGCRTRWWLMCPGGSSDLRPAAACDTAGR